VEKDRSELVDRIKDLVMSRSVHQIYVPPGTQVSDIAQ